MAARSPEGIVLADSAARRLDALSQAEGRELMLRVAVDGGGCSGFQYRMELIEAADADDLVIQAHGRALVVDPVSVPFLKGSEVAYVDELAGAQFVVRNPNAASSCGCGVSFSI
ncbi:MAG: iron-sulfur cluster insertion protein ErpA [Brevundimonas sp.]|uniref:iron-sulfur cluster insertion protein ErpA n=1 Tax=Brevundimonas sp. TaxID=1871086 RepID=UPI00391D35C9